MNIMNALHNASTAHAERTPVTQNHMKKLRYLSDLRAGKVPEMVNRKIWPNVAPTN